MPVREPAPRAALGILLAPLLLHFVDAEQGARALAASHGVHELVRVGRHRLGFPSHSPGAVPAERLIARDVRPGIASACLMTVFAGLSGEPQAARGLAFG